MNLSVIITTKNRPSALVQSLRSIINNGYLHLEIIIVDQSTNNKTHKAVKSFFFQKKTRYLYIRSGESNISIGRNIGIHKSSGDVCVFTDDDCVVGRDWLTTINDSFVSHPKITGLFGSSWPYRPTQHRGYYCPCTMTKKQNKILSTPVIHWEQIGFGNNMAFRKNAFTQFGYFKPWLGIGSIGESAEDAEIALRSLIKGNKIFYNPNAIIYHNKWLKRHEMRKQELSYSCGEMACYGYFYFQGYNFAKSVVFLNIRDSYSKIKHIFKNTLLLRWNNDSITSAAAAGIELLYRSRGLLVGLIYALVDPI